MGPLSAAWTLTELWGLLCQSILLTKLTQFGQQVTVRDKAISCWRSFVFIFTQADFITKYGWSNIFPGSLSFGSTRQRKFVLIYLFVDLYHSKRTRIPVTANDWILVLEIHRLIFSSTKWLKLNHETEWLLKLFALIRIFLFSSPM